MQEYTARLEAQQSCAKQLQEILALRAAMDMAARFGARQLRALRLLPSITLLLERQTEGLHAEGCKASKKPGAASEAQAVHSRYVQKSIGIRGGGPSERGAIHDWAAQYHAFMGKGTGAWVDGVIGSAADESRCSEAALRVAALISAPQWQGQQLLAAAVRALTGCSL